MKQRTKTLLAQAMRLIATAIDQMAQAVRLFACAIEQWDDEDDVQPEPARLLDPDRVEKAKTKAELRRRGFSV